MPPILYSIEYPPQNILFYWERNLSASGYNLYRKSFGGTREKINPTVIPQAKLNYPLMPVDSLPDTVVSVDPVYYKWANLDMRYSSEWSVTEIVGGVESVYSNVVIHYPKPTSIPTADIQSVQKSQMQYWNPSEERYENWDGSVKLSISHLEIGAVDVRNYDSTIGQKPTSESLSVTLSAEQAALLLGIYTTLGASADPVDSFNEVSAVVSGSETTLVEYTVPTGRSLYLKLASFSGENIAVYSLKSGSTLVDRYRTYFTGFNGNFVYPGRGKLFTAGSVVKLAVVHDRPAVATFSGRLFGELI